ncbi:MAG: NAD-dependent DNA ligase LigA [Chitinivibrionales bacterium]|nr:NAD-dependent DNA ligase LigA [Chitinivibrionales bacterium]
MPMEYAKKVPQKFEKVDSISRQDARQEIDKLREAIHYHDWRYYIENDPVISDEAYDRLLNRLQELEAAFPELQDDNSPTSRVGSEPVGALRKRQHVTLMQSLQAALERKKIEDLDTIVRKKAGGDDCVYMVEPKFDGLSVELVYTGGELEYAATRGDGRTGEDISNNARTVKSIPLKLSGNGAIPHKLAVRGELFMTKSGFQELNRQRIANNQGPFANPRNAAAGTVRQLDAGRVAGLPLDMYCYELLDISDKEPSTHAETLDYLHDLGLKTNTLRKLCTTIDEFEAFRNEMEEKREQIDYDIDGVVAKVNDRALRKKLGTRDRYPRWAFAWKFPPRQEITRLYDIVVQVGRTGILTPVALLEPVDIGGVTISRATLHNADEVHRKDIRVGDYVRVARAGDVIPEVVRRVPEKGLKRSKPFAMPEKCPSCGDTILHEGAYHVCPAGLSCRAQLAGRLHHFASRAALNIESLGDKTVQQLVERTMVTDLADLFALEVDDLTQLDLYAEKSANDLYTEIQESKNPPLDRFIYALGIRLVGEHLSRILASHFGTFDAVRSATASQLSSIREIGDESAHSVADFFKDKRNNSTIDRMLEFGVRPRDADTQQSQKLQNATIAITGELESFSRREAGEAVESRGGRATSSVSNNTDYVVAGRNPGSKLDQARDHNVKVIDEKEFEKLLEGGA